jgi:hypothetical protein
LSAWVRAIAGGTLLTVGWVSAIGSIKIARGLYEYSTDWVPELVIAVVSLTAGAWLLRPLITIQPLRGLIDRPLFMGAALAFAGSIVMALAPDAGTRAVGVIFLLYSIAAPLRLRTQARWGRAMLMLGVGWVFCWIVLTGMGSELRVNDDILGLVSLLSPAAFIAGFVLSAVLRLARR